VGSVHRGRRGMNVPRRGRAGRVLPVVVALGGALPVARVLTKYGVTVYGSDFGYSVDRLSRLVSRPPWGYDAGLDDRFLRLLVDFAEQCPVMPVLIPTADAVIEFVTLHYEVLSAHYHVASVYAPGQGEAFLAKREFYRLCDQAGIKYPATIFGDEGPIAPDEVERVLRFPVIVKPNLIHRWKQTLKGEKVIEVTSAADLRMVMASYPGLVEDSMLQEVIPGPESKIYLFKACLDRDGEVLDTFTGRKLRQYPPMYGSASLAESVECPEVEELSLRFFDRIRVHGLGGAEFKWDPRDGEFKMIEVNMRPQLWEDLIRASGKDMLWVHYCDLIGLPVHKTPLQVNGVRWVHLTRDVVSALWFMRRRELTVKEWFGGYRRDMVDALMAPADPLTIPGALGYAAFQFVHYKL